MGTEGIDTSKLVYKLFINFYTKRVKRKGVIVVPNKLIELSTSACTSLPSFNIISKKLL